MRRERSMHVAFALEVDLSNPLAKVFALYTCTQLLLASSAPKGQAHVVGRETRPNMTVTKRRVKAESAEGTGQWFPWFRMSC